MARSRSDTRLLAEQLRAEVQACGLSSYKLGQLAGVDPRQVDRFVAGDRDLTLGTAAKLAQVLELELCRRRGRSQPAYVRPARAPRPRPASIPRGDLPADNHTPPPLDDLAAGAAESLDHATDEPRFLGFCVSELLGEGNLGRDDHAGQVLGSGLSAAQEAPPCDVPI
jgi:transcriptional regulator with XRE-family HTH domain